ncbi:hypothetical protein [Patulibacter sp. SYSU D01012]|uniref:hypothetical protein n=1 Tax=Patulibacter sp. SYSU D01012 TaxID=2817381 RepID=UPI001B3096DD|nr:hypothetical protein [Patulibacter sp. SYSU D01012]
MLIAFGAAVVVLDLTSPSTGGRPRRTGPGVVHDVLCNQSSLDVEEALALLSKKGR